LDLKQLEYFRHVAELGSFTNAAAFLSVGQPTLSRQIADLETEFGQELFDRNGRGVVLTQAGSQLLEHTRGILMQVGRARQELETTRSGDAGHITLGLPSSLGNVVTVPLIKAFAKALPKSRLAFSEGLSAYILERLSVGRIDCALAYNATGSEDFDVAPLLEDQLFLIAPASRSKKSPASISLAELADYPLVIPGRPHANRMTVEHALSDIGKKNQDRARGGMHRCDRRFGASGPRLRRAVAQCHQILALGRTSADQAHTESHADVSAVDRDFDAAAEERLHAQGDFVDRQSRTRRNRAHQREDAAAQGSASRKPTGAIT